MKNYSPGGEVNERLDEIDTRINGVDTRINTIETELDAEKLWSKSGNDLVPQTDINGTIDKLDVGTRRITGVDTLESEDTDAANVLFANSAAVKFALIL